MIRDLVTAEITGADIPGTLRTLTESGITLLCTVVKGELSVQVTLPGREFGKLEKICGKRSDCVKIIRHTGAYWSLGKLMGRPVLLIGIVLVLALTLYLPCRVMFVQVQGNENIPSGLIIDAASRCGIRFGVSRRAVRSERMKNALLEAIPQLQWAGINTRGTVAVISVRERPEETAQEEPCGFGHIIAHCDAVVISCTATRGTLLCSPGQAVHGGQILISGYTDTGLSIRAGEAAGEIMGQTMRKIEAVTPAVSFQNAPSGKELKKISVIIGKKRINLWKDSGIFDATCDRMYEEYYITLPGGFRLPMAFAVERFTVVERHRQQVTQAKAQALLSAFAQNYLKQTMIAGSIRSRHLHFENEPDAWRLTGEYRCTELIGTLQRQQIGE